MKNLYTTALLLVFLFFSISAISLASDNSSKFTIHADLRDLMLKEGYKEIPLYWRQESKTLLIKAAFGSENPQWFIIDSGAVVSSIDPKIVTSQKLIPSKETLILNGSDNSHQRAVRVKIPQLTIGDLISYNLDAYMVDHSFININSQKIAGTLGLDFLYSHLAVLDMANHRLYLKAGTGLFNPKSLSLRQLLLETAGYQSQTFQHALTGNQLIMMGVNDASPVSFVVDTGSPFTMLSLNYAQKLALKITTSKKQAIGIGGKNMNIFTTSARKLTLDKSIWSLPQIAAINFNFIDSSTPLHGILGTDWLEQGQAVVDFAGDRIFMKA